MRRILLLAPILLGACADAPRTAGASPEVARAIAQAADQVRRCYRTPRVPSAARQIITRLAVRYGADGSVQGMPAIVAQTGVTPETRPYASAMAEAARLAVLRCSPVRLPPGLHAGWGDLYLTFSPRGLA